MPDLSAYRVTFIADVAFIQALKDLANEDPRMIVESERTEKDATRLGFDLAAAATVVTIITGALYTGELAARVLAWLRHMKGNKIILQTPFKTLELHKSAELTEEDVRRFLQAAQKV